MQAYLGTKVILAEEMSEGEFNAAFEGKVHPAEQVDREGYHVQYSNPGGGKYDSWSPKDVFERAYRKVSEDEKNLLIE